MININTNLTVSYVNPLPNNGGYYSIKANDTWYSTGKTPPICKEGDVIQGDVSVNGTYSNIDRISIVSKKAGGVAIGAAGIQVGACLNNAISLVCAGKINMEQIEEVVIKLIKLGDRCKNLSMQPPITQQPAMQQPAMQQPAINQPAIQQQPIEQQPKDFDEDIPF